MPIKYSPNYNFVLVDSSDTDVTQISYVVGTSGSQETSNFMILDATLKKIEDAMGASTRIYVDAVSADGTTYTATTADISEYVDDMVVIVSLSRSNTGAVSLNINGFGAKYIKRYNASGSLVDMTNEDLKSGVNYLLRYNGEYFILLTPVDVTLNCFVLPSDRLAVTIYPSESFPVTPVYATFPFCSAVSNV